MITPRPQWNLEFAQTVELDLRLLNKYESDDPALQQRQDAFNKMIRSIKSEFKTLDTLFKNGRVETITKQRNELAAQLRTIADRQREHEISLDLEGINRASTQQQQARTAYHDLKNNPINRSRSTDAEWNQYEQALNTTHAAWQAADRKVIEAESKHSIWQQKRKTFSEELLALERQIELLDFERDVLLGRADPNKRVFSADNGLMMAGAVGIIRR
jgi:hypothetical protein